MWQEKLLVFLEGILMRWKKEFAVFAKERMLGGKELVPGGMEGQARDLAGDQVGVSGAYIDDATQPFLSK